MKKVINSGILLTLLCIFAHSAQAQLKVTSGKQVNETSVVTWPFTLGNAGQTATYSGTTSTYFNQDYVGLGSNLKYVDYRTTLGVTFTRFQPFVQSNAVTANDFVSFNVRTKTGMTFEPTAVSFTCVRYGTDGGFIDLVWQAADGTKTTLQTALKPARDNTAAPTLVNLDVSALSIVASAGESKLLVYIYGLGTTKQVGLSNIVITGTLDGEVVNIPVHAVTTAVSPSGAGTVTSNPVGNSFDQGTEVTLTANRNFGYSFSHWANDADEVVSTANPYVFTLNAATSLKAVFNAINTYSLTLNVDGGGKDYMVNISPAPTMVGGVRMYEEGVNVTLTASNNPILTFSNWSTGETSPQKVLAMTENRNITAVFSAVDYIVGWDFYNPGNNGRTADFFANDDNQVSTLILRNADGTTQGWLDKSQVAAGGYEGKPAAVNWRPLADKYYYQISFDATNYSGITVKSSLLFNYNAYSVQQIEYSLDGTSFTKIDEVVMSSAKAWYDKTISLPAAADHASKVYVRWIPDYTSAVVGTTSANDGTALAEIFVFGTASAANDGVAPLLVSSVPANNATGASATGKVILNFDEKVQIVEGTTATLGSKTLTPVVSGKTISFSYVGLDYNTPYTFTLSGSTVSDLGGNVLTTPVTVSFTTINRPVVAKKKFDFVVGVDGDFKAALLAAQNASASGNRFHIFFPNGEYNIGANTGDANQMTTINTPKLSLVGQSADNVLVYNKSIQEAINSTATVAFTSNSSDNYLQEISLMNKMDYRTGTLVGRGVVLMDQGNKNIYKGVKLLSNQDTYYSNNAGRTYFENSAIHGTVDFICGGGDVFFNECLIYLEERSGNVITAPASGGNWGYVFNSCTIDGFAVNNNGYRLGRPWSNAPKAVFLNTTMNVLPIASGWGDPMNVVPAVFAEYNSMTSTGTAVDLSNRRTTYTKDATTVVLNPVLSQSEAANYSIENVLGGTDTWQPKLYTDQAATPVINGNASLISWANNDYVLCWGVFKNNVLVEFVTTNSYTIPGGTDNSTVYTVRAANEMGGLSATSNEYVFMTTGIDSPDSKSEVISRTAYTIDGKRIMNPEKFRGAVIIRTIYANGKVETSKLMNLHP